ncbi:hypothetical protein [Yeosuana marina]|uniref:hypothetical protein n=1 Tax=Yeosuana marina TaxID=1565536 RepID=UPI0030C806DF
MKSWKKIKIKFKQNKIYRMFIYIAAGCQIGAIVFGVLASFQKNEIDDIDKAKDNEFKNEILKATKNTEFNSECGRFFEEHNSEFGRFSQYFLKGYIVIRQDKDNTLCRKTYGDKHYTDFSKYKIYKKGNEYLFHTKFEFASNLFGKNSTIINSSFSEDNRIDMGLLNTPQRIWGWSIDLPDGQKVVNAIVLIRNIEPYVYAFGLTFKDRTISVRK